MVEEAKRFEGMAGSAIRDVLQRLEAMRGAGHSVVDFSIGRPNFDTPALIKDATVAALKAGKVHYGPNAGIDPLRQGIAAQISASHGGTWAADQVVITNGAVEGLYVAALSVLDPGDEVLIPEPSWPYYGAICRLIGAEPVFVPTRFEDGFQIDAAALQSGVTPKTKAIFVNAPNNPTGAALSAASRQAITALAVAHDLLVISDEVYDRIVIGDASVESIAALPGMSDRTAIIGAFSKTYSMTGWRIGYAVMPKPLARAAVLGHTYINTSINTFIQDGAVAALDHGADAVASMVADYNRRHALVYRALSEMPGVFCNPAAGGFFLFPRFADHPEDTTLARRLLEEAHVATVPGSAFGPSGRGHLRLSFACDLQACQDGVDRIRGWLRQ